MKPFNLVRAALVAVLPFLLLTLKSVQVTGEAACSHLVFTTPCVALPLQDTGALVAAVVALIGAGLDLWRTSQLKPASDELGG